MAKPSSKTTARPRAPAKPAPEAAPAAPDAMFDDAATPPAEPADQVREDAQGTSPEADAAEGTGEALGGQEQEAPAPVEQPAAGEDGEQLFDELFGDEHEAEALAPEPEAEPVAPSADPERVTIGQTEGLQYRLPVEVVRAILGEGAEERVDVLRTSTSIAALQKRMRASDGRCTPMIFTSDHPDTVPALFAGLEIMAAALNLGLSHVSVITIRTEDAGAVQSHVAHMLITKPKESEDDLIWRVHAED
jgi:hypothetical protein